MYFLHRSSKAVMSTQASSGGFRQIVTHVASRSWHDEGSTGTSERLGGLESDVLSALVQHREHFDNFPFVVRGELLTGVTMEKVSYATCVVLHFCSRGTKFWRGGPKLGREVQN